MAKETDISTALPNYSNKSKNNPTSDSLFSGIIKSMQTSNLNMMNNFNGSIIGAFIPN
jgi:hypothetical protein